MNTKIIAQNLIVNPDNNPVTIKGPLEGINTISDLINRVLIFVLPLASVILFLVLVWGGFDFLTSGGSADKIKSGRAKITSALIGFVILVFAYGATRLIAFMFGLDKNGVL